ncbi:hypothetical protein BGS_0345 [Beggiatoa sp. SS]|nr:hypothetical protein BGS_0345 [Beggiatoa sp. SS]
MVFCIGTGRSSNNQLGTVIGWECLSFKPSWEKLGRKWVSDLLPCCDAFCNERHIINFFEPVIFNLFFKPLI